MTRIANLIAGLILVVTMAIATMPSPAASAQPQDSLVDLANLPLPVDALPEPGYQVLTGGYLDYSLTTHWIASPRSDDPESVSKMLTRTGWVESYVLDHVLLEDRAWADSEILSLIQTTVYLFADEDGAEDAVEELGDFSGSSAAETVESMIQEATTVRLTSQSGDTYRSVAQHDRLVIEVVSLERFRKVETEAHRRVIAGTFDRLGEVLSRSSQVISPHAVLIGDGNRVAELFNAQQTGVHQLYRVRDDVVQPAAGELGSPTAEVIAPGLSQLYQAGQVVNVGQGNGFYSSWIGEFHDEGDANAFVANLPKSASGALLPDPYFTTWADEEAISQGVGGVYRVSGFAPNGPFSGTLEIQQFENYVIGIGWRTSGNVTPSVDVTSRLMDAQLSCLAGAGRCPILDLDALLPPGSATPIPPGEVGANTINSAEFGWSLRIDPSVWGINEQFVEPGYDFIELQSGNSLVTLESVVDQQGDPQACVLDEMHALQDFEEHAVIELGSDNPDEVPAGLESRHGWAVYTVEPLAEERADQEYTIRIDCYTIMDGATSLIMTHRAPRYEWGLERDKGIDLRDALLLP